MKSCFVLQRRFTHLAHNLAILLKEKYGLNDFCGYVYIRSKYEFLKNQKDIQYGTLLLDEDVHKKYKEEKLDLNYLRWLEKEYGLPNLWPYITVDRVIMYNQLVREYPYAQSPYTHEEMLRILQAAAKAILSFLEKEKPDFILFSVIGGISVTLLYHIAKKKGIKTLVLLMNMADKTIISEDCDKLSGIKNNWSDKISNNVISAEAINFLEQSRRPPIAKNNQSGQQTTRFKQLQFLLPKNFIGSLRWQIHSFYNHLTTKDKHDYSYISPWNSLKDGLKRKVRNLIGVNDLYDKPDWGEDFAFFPLHLEPESTLLLLANFKTNQTEVIKQIARSLPVGYKIYIKEHPIMVMYRPRSFYKELKKIPNLKLINPLTASYDLIKNAKIIITITGTVGWEAALLKKPVITFGNVFYNQLSFVKNCHAFEDLPWLVKEQLENFKYDENELLNYLTALFEYSATINIGGLWDEAYNPLKQRQGLIPLADALAKKLNLQKNA